MLADPPIQPDQRAYHHVRPDSSTKRRPTAADADRTPDLTLWAYDLYYGALEIFAHASQLFYEAGDRLAGCPSSAPIRKVMLAGDSP